MATHSSTLAWRIWWTEKPDRLQSMVSQRVGHNSATEHTFSSFALLAASNAQVFCLRPQVIPHCN